MKIITKPFNLNVSAQFYFKTSNKNSAELDFTLFGLRSFNSEGKKCPRHNMAATRGLAWPGLVWVSLVGWHWVLSSAFKSIKLFGHSSMRINKHRTAGQRNS